MLCEILFLQQNGSPIGDRRDPGHADFRRLRAVCRSSTERNSDAEAGQQEFQKAHDLLPIESNRYSCFSSKPDSRSTRSLDHLIGAGLQRERYIQAESLRGLEVDDKLELGGLLDRQLGRLGAGQDAIDVRRGAAKQIGE